MTSPLMNHLRRASNIFGERQYGSLNRESDNLVPCPSCRGVGQVPKDFESQLIALIPMKDKRLKPRRTMMYVFIAVFVCAVVAGLLIFFLMPRDITLSSNNPFLHSNHVVINASAPTVTLHLVPQFNLSNSNYLGISVTGVQVTARYYQSVLGTAVAFKDQPMEVGLRSDAMLSVPITIMFQKDQGETFVRRCNGAFAWEFEFYLSFDVNVNYTLLTQSNQAPLTTFQQTSCKPTQMSSTSTNSVRTVTLPTT